MLLYLLLPLHIHSDSTPRLCGKTAAAAAAASAKKFAFPSLWCVVAFLPLLLLLLLQSCFFREVEYAIISLRLVRSVPAFTTMCFKGAPSGNHSFWLNFFLVLFLL